MIRDSIWDEDDLEKFDAQMSTPDDGAEAQDRSVRAWAAQLGLALPDGVR